MTAILSPTGKSNSVRNRAGGSSRDLSDDEPTGTTTSPSHWLLHRSEMPRWARLTGILRGYRPIHQSITYCLGTVFSLHNESGNIWTHLFGTAMFIGLYCHVMHYNPVEMAHRMKLADYVLLNMFFVGVIGCLLLSSIFHTFSCHSERAVKFLSKLDYCGITLLIACSFVPWLYYAWYNSPLLQAFYIGVSLFFASGCIVVSLWDKFGERHYQKYRAALFLGDGLSAILPAIHWVSREVINSKSTFLELNHRPGILLAIMGVTYTVGGLLYLFKVPEHLSPGRFDLWLHSHQVFHVLVVAGGLLYYHSITQLINLRLGDPNHFYN